MMKVLFIALFLFARTAFCSANTFQVRANPVHVIKQFINVELGYSFGLSSVGLGTTRVDRTIYEFNVKLTEYNLRYCYWPNGAFNQGWFFDLLYSSVDVKLKGQDYFTANDKVEGDLKTAGFGFGAGFRWKGQAMFVDLSTHFLSYPKSDVTIKNSSNSSGDEAIPAIYPDLELHIGWVF